VLGRERFKVKGIVEEDEEEETLIL